MTRVSSPAPRPPLGGPFWRLWTASTLSNLADGVLKTALPLLALRYTDSPALIAGLAIALTLPWLLCSLPAGALADRHDRRRLMVGANVVRGSLLAALAVTVIVDAGTIWVLYLVAFCIGISETVYDTSAQSILPQIVPRSALSSANGRLHAAELTANQFIGPPLGGFLVAAGVAVALLTPAGLWAVAVGVLLLVRGRFRVERAASTTMRDDIAEGLRYLMRHRMLRTLAIMVGTFNFASNAAFAVFVLYAVGPASAMGLSEPAYGVLLAVIAAGSLAGALVADRLEVLFGRARSLLVAIPMGASLLAVPALTSDVVAVGASFFAGGIGLAIANVLIVSLRQRIVPDRLLGRVNSGFRLVAWGTMPVGALVGGLLAETVGLRATFGVMAVLALSLVGFLTVVSDAAIEAAERDAPQ